MTNQAMREDYWESLEEDQMTILDHVRSDAPDWEVLAVDVAGEIEEESVLFLLVIRRRVNEDDNLILSERYYRFDLEEEEGNWLSNGIERRVTGSLAAALRVLYAATTNGDVDPDDPMLMDSRDDGLAYHPDELTEGLGDLLEEPEPGEVPEVERTETGKRVSVHESVEDTTDNDLEGAARTPTCESCGEPVEDKSQALNIGAALGQDVWVHHRCNGGDDGE